MERYLEASSQVIDKAAGTYNLDNTSTSASLLTICAIESSLQPQIRSVNVDGSYVDVGHGDRKSDRVYADRFKGVPSDGYYTIRVKAEAINRINRYDPDLLGIDPDEPVKMEVLVTDPNVNYPGRRYNASDRVVASIPLLDHQTEMYEIKPGWKRLCACDSLCEWASALQRGSDSHRSKVSSRGTADQLARRCGCYSFRKSGNLSLRCLRGPSNAHPLHGDRRTHLKRR